MNLAQLGIFASNPGGYSAAAQSVFSKMATALPTNYKTAIATFVDGQQALGQWTNVIEFWLWANDTQANSLKGWKGVVDSTFVGSPTWNTLTGPTLNGSSQYIDSGFIPNTHASANAAKLAVGAFIKENLDTGNAKSLLGTTLSGGGGRIELTQAPSSAAINCYTANSSQIGVSEGAHDDKIFDSETSYTAVQLAGTGYMYKDGIQIASAAKTNNGLSTLVITFGAANINAVITQYMNCKLSAGWVIDPTNFDFRAFYLGLKTMLQTLGVFASTPELTIPTGGEWFDFSQASVGTLTSLVGRKGLLTCAGLNSPTIESVSGVNMLRCNPTGSKAIDTSSVFSSFYSGTSPSSFSILLTVKPNDGTPSSAQAFFGHTNTTNGVMYSRIGTDGKITIGFKESTQAEVTTVTDNTAFNDPPTFVSILIFEFIKDDMIVYVNGIRVSQTEASWGTRVLSGFDGGTRNMYIGAENVDGVVTNVLDGYIGDFMIRRGGWSQSQKERLFNYFA